MKIGPHADQKQEINFVSPYVVMANVINLSKKEFPFSLESELLLSITML